MARSLGKGPIGYSQRTGRKVRAVDLVEDGENRGLVVERSEADREHPQKFAKRVPADRISLRHPMPEASVQPCTINIGWEAPSDLWEGRQAFRHISLVLGNALVTHGGGSTVV